MVKSFNKNERKIANTLSIGTNFNYKGEHYEVTLIAKPLVSQGECKTDIYLEAKNDNNVKKEFKISYKQENAQFIENKIQADRAKSLLGPKWKDIIQEGTFSIKEKFENRPIVIKKGSRNGSITLGWKYELLDVKSGELSSKLNLTEEQVKDIYSGKNLPSEKRDANVQGQVIKDSGVANFMLRTDELDDAQQIIDSLQTIDEYVKQHPDVYFACKALNYRTFESKYDGDRPLAVQINWKEKDNELVPEFAYDEPLVKKGNVMAEILVKTLEKLDIQTTDEITKKYSYLVNRIKE
ncbi:TPA: hypothetical protein TZM57_000085 [Streptococcus suis]|nr:hypothetical protein [Streptococcus suis]